MGMFGDLVTRIRVDLSGYESGMRRMPEAARQAAQQTAQAMRVVEEATKKAAYSTDPLMGGFGALASAMPKTTAHAKAMGHGMNELSQQLDRVSSAAMLLPGPLGQAGMQFFSLSMLAKSVSGSTVAMVAGFAATAAGLAGVTKMSIDATLQYQRINNALRVGTGSAKDAGEAYNFVRGEARRLGLDLAQTGEEFSKLSAAARGTSLSGEQTKEIFTALAEASTVLGLSGQRAGLALFAFQQMISKGVVSQEELRRQLGDLLPGAFEMAAKAMGITTMELNKLVESGQLMTADFLPKFAKEMRRVFGDEAKVASLQLQSSMNRVSTEWFELGRTIGEVTKGPVTSFFSFVAEELQRTTVQVQGLIAAWQRLKGLMPSGGAQGPTPPAKTDLDLMGMSARDRASLERVRRMMRGESATTPPGMIFTDKTGPEMVRDVNPAALPFTPAQTELMRDLRLAATMAGMTPGRGNLAKLRQELDDKVKTAGPGQMEARRLADQIYREAEMSVKLDEVESGYVQIGGTRRLISDIAAEQKGFHEGLSGSLTPPKIDDQLDEIERGFITYGGVSRRISDIAAEEKALGDIYGPGEMIDGLKKLKEQLDEIESSYADVAKQEKEFHDGISGTKLEMHASEKALKDYNDEVKTLRNLSGLLGKDFDAATEEIALLESALRKAVSEGMDPADERLQAMSKHLGELKQAQALKSIFQDVFGSVSSAIEKMATGVIQGTLKMRDAFRNLAQSIIVEFTQKVIRQALNPLISAMAQAAGSAVSSIFPGVFTSGAGGAMSLSAGGAAAALGGLGVAGIAYGGIANNSMIATGGGLASIGYGGYNLYNAARGTTTGMTASGAGIGGSTLGSAASVGAGLGVLGGALAIAGAQSNNRQLMAAGQLASVASTGVGLYGAATGTGMAATGGMMAAAAPAMAYIGAAVLAAMSAYNAVMVSGDNWKKIPEAQRTGTKYGAYLSPINLASFGALGALVPEEYSAYIDPISAYIGGLFGSLFGGSPKQTIQLPGMNYPITTYESGIKTLIKSYEEGIGGANAFSGALGKAESTGMLLSVLNRPWSQHVGQFQIQGRSGAGAQVANIGGSRTLPWARKFNAQDLQDPALIESLRVFAGMVGAPAEQQSLAKFLKEFIPAVVKADKEFRGEIDKIRTLVMPYLTTAETDPFKTGMAGVEDVFSKKGVKAAQEAFSEFQQSQTNLWNSIMQRVQSMKDAMTEAFTNAFQANSVAQGVEVFAQTLRAQVVQAVQSGLVEALTSSEAFHSVLLPALQPIRETMARVAGAKPEELTPAFFAERKAEIGTIFAGINERFGKIAPIVEAVLGFSSTLGEMIGLRPAGATSAVSGPLGVTTMLGPRRHSGGWTPGYGEASIVTEPGEYVVRRRVAKRHAATLETLNETGALPASGPQTVIINVQVGNTTLGRAVVNELNKMSTSGFRGVIPADLVAPKRQG